jgi:hypothetical protein
MRLEGLASQGKSMHLFCPEKLGGMKERQERKGIGPGLFQVELRWAVEEFHPLTP